MSTNRLQPAGALLRLENMRINKRLVLNKSSRFDSETSMLTNIMLGTL